MPGPDKHAVGHLVKSEQKYGGDLLTQDVCVIQRSCGTSQVVLEAALDVSGDFFGLAEAMADIRKLRGISRPPA